MSGKAFHRKNGLQWPLSPIQVFTWVLTLCPLLCQILIALPLHPTDHRVFWTVIFCVYYLLGVSLFVYATLSEHPLPSITASGLTHYCKYCDTYVPNHTKHCRECNKCRFGFDHHCIYINNCVTVSNYTHFFYGILSLTTVAIISIVQAGININRLVVERDATLARFSSFYKLKETNFIVICVLIGITILINLGLLIPLGVLIGFHVYFQFHEVTTFQFIKTKVNSDRRLARLLCPDPETDYRS